MTFTALFVLLLGGHQPFGYITLRVIDVAIGVATGLAVNIVLFPPLQLRPAEHAIGQWGEGVARALEDLSQAAAGQGDGIRSWPAHDHQLSASAERARGASKCAQESLRWNPRARSGQRVPRPDGAVLDALEELTARTRAIARSLPDLVAGPDQSSFGPDYATTLRALAGPVRQLADLRDAPSAAALDAVRDGQHQLERAAARGPDHDGARSVPRQLTRLTGEMLNEVAEHTR